MRVLITGDREQNENRYPIDRIAEELTKLPANTVIIHGACTGVDTAAGLISKELGFEVIEYPAKWSEYGKAAGMIRNRMMYDQELPDLVMAFHTNIEKSKGTKGMMKYAESKGCKVILFSS